MHTGGAGLANHLGVTARLLWLRHYHRAERLRDFGHTTLFCSTNKHASRKVASFVFKQVQIATAHRGIMTHTQTNRLPYASGAPPTKA